MIFNVQSSQAHVVVAWNDSLETFCDPNTSVNPSPGIPFYRETKLRLSVVPFSHFLRP